MHIIVIRQYNFQISSPWQIIENWEVSSQRHKPMGKHWACRRVAVWRADVAKDKRHRCFRLLISWQAKAARVKSSPLCYQNFNNWIVIGSNNSVDPVNITLNKHSQEWKIFWGEFDPGSGWTLAACLIHASRTVRRKLHSGERVSNALVTYPKVWDNSPKGLLIPHVVIGFRNR